MNVYIPLVIFYPMFGTAILAGLWSNIILLRRAFRVFDKNDEMAEPLYNAGVILYSIPGLFMYTLVLYGLVTR